MTDKQSARGYRNMERDKAIRRIEEVEDQLAKLIRESKEYSEDTTEVPVIDTSEVEPVRQKLTDARADLVRGLMQETFTSEVDNAEPGDTIVFDEVRGTVKNIEKDNDE